jgi:hypothetical protein
MGRDVIDLKTRNAYNTAVFGLLMASSDAVRWWHSHWRKAKVPGIMGQAVNNLINAIG